MNKPVFFDHIEVHVNDIQSYCQFLQKLFCGGRYNKISTSGTSMFQSFDGISIEVKKRKPEELPLQSGFCNPCLRMESAKEHIENTIGLEIIKTMNNPDGKCYFFKDHENITWHIKEYLVRDRFVNW